MERHHSRRPVALALTIAVLLGVGLVTLGGGADASTDADLPVLPETEQRLDDLYDDQGCLRTGLGEQDCSVTAEDLDEALEGDDTDDVRHLTGFTGADWLDAELSGDLTVLAETVTTTAGENTEVLGLVRNETSETVPAIQVTAELLDDQGLPLGELSGQALVSTVRSGEPVPFVLTGPGLERAVDSITWTAKPVDASSPSRDIEWQRYWEQPAGERDPLETHLYVESGTGPHPHVLFGSVRNLSDEPLDGIMLVTAWFADDGRLAAIGQAAAVDQTGSAIGQLAPEAAADVLVVADNVPVGAAATAWAVEAS